MSIKLKVCAYVHMTGDINGSNLLPLVSEVQDRTKPGSMCIPSARYEQRTSRPPAQPPTTVVKDRGKPNDTVHTHSTSGCSTELIIRIIDSDVGIPPCNFLMFVFSRARSMENPSQTRSTRISGCNCLANRVPCPEYYYYTTYTSPC